MFCSKWQTGQVNGGKRSTTVRSGMRQVGELRKVVGELIAIIVFGSQGIVPHRAPDAVSPRQCPTKKYRLTITTLRTPDARSAQSNIVIVRFQSYAPTLRCRCVATPRLVANKDYLTAPSFRPRRGFAAFAKCFRLDTASALSSKGRRN